MILSMPLSPEWVERCLRAAGKGEPWGDACYDSRCHHGIPPHPKLPDCPWFGREPSEYGFTP